MVISSHPLLALMSGLLFSTAYIRLVGSQAPGNPLVSPFHLSTETKILQMYIMALDFLQIISSYLYIDTLLHPSSSKRLSLAADGNKHRPVARRYLYRETLEHTALKEMPPSNSSTQNSGNPLEEKEGGEETGDRGH